MRSLVGLGSQGLACLPEGSAILSGDPGESISQGETAALGKRNLFALPPKLLNFLESFGGAIPSQSTCSLRRAK